MCVCVCVCVCVQLQCTKNSDVGNATSSIRYLAKLGERIIGLDNLKFQCILIMFYSVIIILCPVIQPLTVLFKRQFTET